MTLLGLSLGGWMAVRHALSHPERISRLVLVDAGGYRDQDWERIQSLVEVRDLAGVDRLYRALFFKAPWVMRLSKATFLKVYTSPAVTNVLAELSETDTFDDADLGSLRMPAALIWAEQDGLFTVETGRAMAAAIPRPAWRSSVDCGHAIHMERPRALTAALQRFRRARIPQSENWRKRMASPEYYVCLECETPCYTFEWEDGKLREILCVACGNDNADEFRAPRGDRRDDVLNQAGASTAVRVEGWSGWRPAARRRPSCPIPWRCGCRAGRRGRGRCARRWRGRARCPPCGSSRRDRRSFLLLRRHADAVVGQLQDHRGALAVGDELEHGPPARLLGGGEGVLRQVEQELAHLRRDRSGPARRRCGPRSRPAPAASGSPPPAPPAPAPASRTAGTSSSSSGRGLA